MLKIQFGFDENTVSAIEPNFKYNFEPEWFEDQFVKDMVLDVDKSEIVAPYCINSPVFGQISPFLLSGGVQALVLMYKTNYIINASRCGDNCAKWILEIAKKKDLTIHLRHIMDFDVDFDAIILNNGKEIHTNSEYIDAAINYLRG